MFEVVDLRKQGAEGNQDAEVDAYNLQMVAKRWRKVEYIMDVSSSINAIIQLLGCLKFDALRSLRLLIVGDASTNQRRERTEALIKAIHNAPSLETLSFSSATLKIADLEILQGSTTKLKQLELRDIQLYTDDIVENQVPCQPAKCLEPLTMAYIEPAQSREEGRILEGNQTLDDAIKHWVSYIGKKYPQLWKLHLASAGQYTQGKGLIAKSLAIGLKNMKHLRSYTISNLCSISQPILDVMDSNDILLDHFRFSIDANDMITETFKSVQTANSVSTILSLEVAWKGATYQSIVGQGLTDLWCSLKNLTNLRFTCYGKNMLILLLDILQNVTTLKSLEFEDMMINDDT